MSRTRIDSKVFLGLKVMLVVVVKTSTLSLSDLNCHHEPSHTTITCAGNGSTEFQPPLRSPHLLSLHVTNYSVPTLKPVHTSQLKLLQKLAVTNCRLQEITGDALMFAPMLIFLNMSHNLLTELPRTLLANNTQLQNLDLSHNRLRHVRWQWPQTGSPGREASIRRLNLSYNRIRQLESTAFEGLFHMQYLDLSGNQLTLVPAGTLTVLENLETLMLAENPLFQLQSVQLMSTRLRFINVSGTRLTALPRPEHGQVETLLMTHTPLQQLHDYDLDNYRHVQTLVLDHNRISVIEAFTFSWLNRLTLLSLRDNQLTHVPSHLPPKLETLQLSRNKIEKIKTGAFITAKSLKTLSLDSNRIDSIENWAFKGATLETIELSHNRIKTLSFQMFSGLHTLQDLFLSDNPISVIEDKSFSPLINLRILSLSNIRENVSIETRVFNALKNLQSLDISHSTDLIVRVMNSTETLASLSNISELDVRGNRLTGIGRGPPYTLLRKSSLEEKHWSCHPYNVTRAKKLKNEKTTLKLDGVECKILYNSDNASITEAGNVTTELSALKIIPTRNIDETTSSNSDFSPSFNHTEQKASEINSSSSMRTSRIQRTIIRNTEQMNRTNINIQTNRSERLKGKQEFPAKSTHFKAEYNNTSTSVSVRNQLHSNTSTDRESADHDSRTASYFSSTRARSTDTSALVALATSATAAVCFLVLALAAAVCMWHHRNRLVHPCTRHQDYTGAEYHQHRNQWWKDNCSDVIYERIQDRRKSGQSVSMTELIHKPPGSEQYFGTPLENEMTSYIDISTSVLR